MASLVPVLPSGSTAAASDVENKHVKVIEQPEEEETTHAELTRVKRLLAAAEERAQEAEEEARRANEACTEMRESAERAERRYEKARSQAEGSYARLRNTKEANEWNYRNDLRSLRGYLEACREDRQLLQAGLETTKTKLEHAHHLLESQSHEIEALRSAMGEKQTMLDTRSAELKEAQAYLSKADTYSHADILQMVQRLNDEILQVACLIHDATAYDGLPRSDEDMSEYSAQMRVAYGDGLVEFIAMARSAQDSSFVQMVLQSVMAYFLAQVVNSWDGTGDESREEFLTAVYTRMTQSEPLAVCGKWKTLTAQYARETGNAVDVNVRVDALIQSLIIALFLFGANGSPEDLYGTTTDSFGTRLVEIVSSAVKLQKAMKEDVLSADFQLIVPSYGDAFVHETMEDVNARPKRRSRKTGSQQPVLCTTDFGLQRTERCSDVSGGAWETDSVIMLKSRVALTSIVADLGQ